MRGLEGKVALVTGGARGMGRSIVLRLAEEGCRIANFDIRPEESAETAALVAAIGGRMVSYNVDITDLLAVRAGVEAVEAELGAIDILVNNAGWDLVKRFLDSDENLWDKIININLRGPTNVIHTVLKTMSKRNKGSIVTISSDAGRVGSSGEAVYSACKGGLIALTKTLAREMARHNIVLNTVCPGPTDGPSMGNFFDGGGDSHQILERMLKNIPLRRIGKPEDVAAIVAFLASDEASFITGQTISVSGGLTMHG